MEQTISNLNNSNLEVEKRRFSEKGKGKVFFMRKGAEVYPEAVLSSLVEKSALDALFILKILGVISDAHMSMQCHLFYSTAHAQYIMRGIASSASGLICYKRELS